MGSLKATSKEATQTRKGLGWVGKGGEKDGNGIQIDYAFCRRACRLFVGPGPTASLSGQCLLGEAFLHHWCVEAAAPISGSGAPTQC